MYSEWKIACICFFESLLSNLESITEQNKDCGPYETFVVVLLPFGKVIKN